jgi:hypothetical protein
MREMALIIYQCSSWSGSARTLIVIPLPSPSPNKYEILKKYAEKYDFPLLSLTCEVVEVLKDEELTRFD